MTWRRDAACRGMNTDDFYPRQGESQLVVAEVKAVCAGCPVQVDCLDEALARNEQHGIWGGMSSVERKAEMKRRNR